MTRLFAQIATSGLIAIAPFASATVAFAQASPDITTDDSSNVTDFLIDYVPNNCTVQLGYFEGDEVAVVGTQSVEALIAENPLLPCNSITGSDNGTTKNFNFVSENSAVYKLITASNPVSPATNPNVFTVLAMQIIPLDGEGAPSPEDIIQLSTINEGVCEVDSVEAPQAVVCEFTALSDMPSAAMGRLSYSW